MNEQIKELTFKAGAKLYSEPPMRQVTGVSMSFESVEKFAHLIVQECVEICRKGINNATDWDSSYWDQACENRAETIRQHFGVTE